MATGSGTPTGGVEFYDGSTDLVRARTRAAGYGASPRQPCCRAAIRSRPSTAATTTSPATSLLNPSWSTARRLRCEPERRRLCERREHGERLGQRFQPQRALGSASTSIGRWPERDTDNGGQPFYFAAGTTSFSISHYYNTVGGYTLDVTAAASDGRQVEDNTSVSVTVVGVVPKVVLIEPP